MEFADRVIELLRVRDDAAARTEFAAGYPALYPDLKVGRPLERMAVFFYELDEFLNHPEAVRAGAVTWETTFSSFQELQAEIENQP